ncbi:ATPase, histidine kinase-, DNA gyrase B (macronuclear) [Tetrahymena thermophila SB210]|uniref:histidine kinase n=1 Tax=Tetrahymena thermophila (strain SB210) TaxID=312017 RepID=Q22D35_TETTS|nr:ATPase, histidine kinase-, DNA gyrase B [Tetrahymena thermophila SB210]EAR83218.2 ATPase, histidine kinase-, DNA gyrase B [Tetrahymena thermophila SB210]|eukprot:XP_001030881.2 ATPase, histidine kinase-, DNA gyrase B [Tetrahymena thermophila SB210]
MLDGFIFQKVEVQKKKLEISVFCSIILLDFITVMLIKKEKINESTHKMSILVITAGVYESFALDSDKFLRIVAFFVLLQICTRNMELQNLSVKFLMLILAIYAQIRFSLSSENEKDIEKGQQFLNIKSKKDQQDDLFLSNRECLREQENNDLNNSQNMSIQVNNKKKFNEFDQSYQITKNNNNGQRSITIQNQYNMNDISSDFVKKFNINNNNKSNLHSYAFEYDNRKQAYILKNEQKPQISQEFQQNISSPNLFSFLNKSLNLISIGIVLINQDKKIQYRNKTVKKFINHKNSDGKNFMQQLLSISLSMFKKEAEKEIQFFEDKQNNNQNNQNINLENKNKQSSTQKKKQIINSILDEQNEKMQKQRKAQKSKINQQEKFGSVLYNQYETSKAQGEQLQNSIGLRRIATAEVMTTENNSYQPQKLVNSNLVQDLGNIIQSNLSNNMNTDYSYQKANSNLSSKNIINKNIIQMKVYGANTSKVIKDNTVSPKILSSENIIQDLNATLTGVPFYNVSPSCRQLNPKIMTKSIFNQNNLNSLNYVNNYEYLNSFNKDSIFLQQSELNQQSFPQQMLSKFIQCLIPENIDQLFKNENLILDDVIDFLLIYSRCPQKLKYNTDYHIQHQSDEEMFDQEKKNYKKSFSQLSKSNIEDELPFKKQLQPQVNPQIDEEEEQEDQKNSQNQDDQNLSILKSEINKIAMKREKSEVRVKNSNGFQNKQQQQQSHKYKEKKSKNKNHQKLYSYFTQNNYLHIHTKLNCSSFDSSEYDNKMTFIEIKLSVLQQEETENQYVLIEVSDVTQFKKVVDKENLDSYKNKILSSVSHELRTPLNCSIQLLDLLSQSEEISDITKNAFVNPAMYSNFLMLNIINDILDLAQINYGKFKMIFSQFDVKKIITECLNLIGLQAMEKHIMLELEIDPQIPQLINSDANRIRQVLLNLLNNALKFTQHGSISVKANLVEPNLIQIDVEDTGCGIKKKDLNKILGQFQYQDELEKSKSTNSLNGGLGLTIANNLATGLGGNRRIKVRSEYKAGSIFSFYIVNHGLNQKGCTYKQTNLFSKQIVNWECFSQYSNQQQTTINNIQKNNSENIHLHQNSSSIKQKKYEKKYSDATQSLMRFNTEILYSNLNVNVSQNKIFYDQPIQQNSNSHNKQSIKKENTCYDVVTPSQYPPSEGGKFSRKFQLSLKNTQQVMEQSNSENNNSPIRPYQNNTQGNLTQKQFAENMSDFQKDEDYLKDQFSCQHQQYTIDSPGKRSESSIKKRFQVDKNSKKTINRLSTHNAQGTEKTAYPSLYDDKVLQSTSILNKSNNDNHESIKVLNNNTENESEFQITTIQNIKRNNSKNIYLESCDLLNISNTELNEQENKKIPNSFQCQEISLKRTQLKPKQNAGSQQMLSSIFGFDQEDSVIKIKFKGDEEKNITKQKLDDQALSQIYEKNSEQIESIQSSYQDIYRNKHLNLNDARVQKLIEQNTTKKNNSFQFDNLFNKSILLSDSEGNNEIDNLQKKNLAELEQQVKQLEQNQIPNEIYQKKQQEQKLKTEKIVNMSSLAHKESYPNNYSSREIQLLQEDIKQQLIKFNQKRLCKCSNILIVDDEGFNLYALELKLKFYGFIVDKAPGGIEALEFVQKKFESDACHKKYDIILMDINMPIKNGYEATEDILKYFKSKNVNQPTQISACSAYIQEEMKKKAKECGMKYYITKPVNQQQLETVLKQAILDVPNKSN